ncbi:MAG: acyl-CoA synthetase FdrA, partial [Anaerolineales bacterium]
MGSAEMADATAYEIRSGTYYDSVVLMQLQRALTELPGVRDAGVVMATPANLELLAQNDLLPDRIDPAPEDLLIVVRADSQTLADTALAEVDELLARRRTVQAGKYRPHSLKAAAEMLPQAEWVLISVPGRYAGAVAREALDLGRNIFLYSDNVPLDQEVEMKRSAAAQGLLIMGPDCGTAVVNGVGFGFANRVRRGSIGLVGASGTGMQAIAARIHQRGAGLSHALGTGGRDLSSQVGGISALHCLDLLASDPDTRVIALVSKPPDPEVASAVLQRAWSAGKPVVVDFIGHPAPAQSLGSIYFANSLSGTADLAVELLEPPLEPQPDPLDRKRTDHRSYLRGLFSGGTIAQEALRGLQALLFPVYSNLAEPHLADPLVSQGHTLLDLGADEFTVGRLHPMLDNDLRIRRLRREAADPQVALILLDLVLGVGAHPDPAAELAPAIEQARAAGEIELGVILIGTDEDPQDKELQKSRLIAAGAQVFEDTGQAVSFAAARLLEARRPKADAGFLSRPVAAINVGVETFYDSLIGQGAPAIQVEWKPPAGGDERLQAILQ